MELLSQKIRPEPNNDLFIDRLPYVQERPPYIEVILKGICLNVYFTRRVSFFSVLCVL